MIEVVAFTGTLTHTGENRITRVLNRDVANQLHHVYSFAHAGATEQADLTAFSEGAEQVDHFNTGFENLGRCGQLVEGGSMAMNRCQLLGFHRARFVNRAAQHIHNAAQGLGADGHHNRCAGAGHFQAAAQAVGGTQRNGAHHTVTQLLLHFER